MSCLNIQTPRLSKAYRRRQARKKRRQQYNRKIVAIEKAINISLQIGFLDGPDMENTLLSLLVLNRHLRECFVPTILQHVKIRATVQSSLQFTPFTTRYIRHLSVKDHSHFANIGDFVLFPNLENLSIQNVRWCGQEKWPTNNKLKSLDIHRSFGLPACWPPRLEHLNIECIDSLSQDRDFTSENLPSSLTSLCIGSGVRFSNNFVFPSQLQHLSCSLYATITIPFSLRSLDLNMHAQVFENGSEMLTLNKDEVVTLDRLTVNSIGNSPRLISFLGSFRCVELILGWGVIADSFPLFLHSLQLDVFLAQDFALLPPTIVRLRIDNFNQHLFPNMLPFALEHLHFDSFNRILPKDVLPSTLLSLHLPCFNSSFHPNFEFPPLLENLSLGSLTRFPLKFPSHLKYFDLSSCGSIDLFDSIPSTILLAVFWLHLFPNTIEKMTQLHLQLVEWRPCEWKVAFNQSYGFVRNGMEFEKVKSLLFDPPSIDTLKKDALKRPWWIE